MSPGVESELAARVAKGAALLDDAWSKDGGWAPLVDPDDLNMQDPRCCVLGQLYGSYPQGTDALGLDGFDGVIYPVAAHGFTLSVEGNSAWPILERLWKDAVDERVAA